MIRWWWWWCHAVSSADNDWCKVTLNFNLWPWPANLVQKLLPGYSNTRKHTHIRRSDCCTWTKKVVGKNCNKSSAVAEMGDRLKLATIDEGRKVWGCCIPFPWGGAGSPSNSVACAEAYLHSKWHLDPSSYLATIHQRYRQTAQTGQRSRSIGRTVTCKGLSKIT